MTNAHSILRSLIIYAVCIPLAVYIGYLLGNPMDLGGFVTLIVVLAVLCIPLLFQFHHPLMVLSWNATAVLFFLPGRPPLWFATIALSFVVSYSQRILNKELRPISVPELTRPLILIGLVVLATAQATGGFGTRALGGDQYGGRRYFYILLAIAGYFAIAAQRIPRRRAILYVGLFCLGSISGVVADLFPVLGQIVPFVFWFIPPYELSFGDIHLGVARLPGTAAASTGIFYFMLAKYGIQGIFQTAKPWRLFAFVLCGVAGLFGGFRSLLIGFIGIFAVQFFLEGLHRTKLFPALVLTITLLGSLALPFTAQLPPTVQRAMAFVPIIPIDPIVRQSAEGSSEWRLRMWKAVLPQVPQYLLLGKGLSMSQQDYGYSSGFDQGALSEDQWGSALAGDYHNGPLSVIIPFGIWGMIAWLWFMVAGFRVLYSNYRYGDADLRIINAFLLANFTARMLMFWLIVGGFYADLLYYTGVLGLSVSLNGGVARPSPATVPAESPVSSLPSVLPRQRPVFSRQGN